MCNQREENRVICIGANLLAGDKTTGIDKCYIAEKNETAAMSAGIPQWDWNPSRGSYNNSLDQSATIRIHYTLGFNQEEILSILYVFNSWWFGGEYGHSMSYVVQWLGLLTAPLITAYKMNQSFTNHYVMGLLPDT